MPESTMGGRKEKREVSSARRWWFRERGQMRVLREVVHTMNGRGPRTSDYSNTSAIVTAPSERYIGMPLAGAISH